MYGVPTMFIAELQHPNFKSQDLTTFITNRSDQAGAPCPMEMMRKVMEDMHCREIHDCLWTDGEQPGQRSLCRTWDWDSVEKRVSTVGDVAALYGKKGADRFRNGCDAAHRRGRRVVRAGVTW